MIAIPPFEMRKKSSENRFFTIMKSMRFSLSASRKNSAAYSLN